MFPVYFIMPANANGPAKIWEINSYAEQDEVIQQIVNSPNWSSDDFDGQILRVRSNECEKVSLRFVCIK